MNKIPLPMSKDLPPEAFTKETLTEAFNWLQEQPEVLRKSVHTPERLVSLFRKAQRLNEVEAPVSSKKFVDDLKDIANSLNQFDSQNQGQSITLPPTKTKKETNTPKKELFDFTTQPTEIPQTLEEPKKPTPHQWDPKTKERIEKVKNRLNLSNETEAIRMLISLGYEKFQNLK